MDEAHLCAGIESELNSPAGFRLEMKPSAHQTQNISIRKRARCENGMDTHEPFQFDINEDRYWD